MLAATPAAAQEIADRIWFGGPILTMEDGAMRAEALAEKGGVILAVGSEASVATHRGAGTRMIDLAGRTMLPGFVDAHGHVFAIGLQALSANLLAPPDGSVTDIAALQATLGDWAAAHPERVARAGLILGFGYDDAQLAELRHPTREALDAVSTETPVYVIHQSGHIGVANSAALAAAGVDAASVDPAGGVIRRRGDGQPDGVLEEAAHFAALMRLIGELDADAGRAIFRAGTELIASFGYTTAQEGRATPGAARLMQAVAREEGLAIDVVAYPDVLLDRDFIAGAVSRDYAHGFRVGGAKLTIDGSPQGFTALRDRPYHAPPSGLRADYRGYAAVTPEQVFDAVDWAFGADIQLLTHANGEGAADLLIAAIRTATAAHGRADRRPVLIHGQFQREDQVDAFVALGVFPSLFPMHTFYWGDWHRERTVGPALVDDISPTGWYRARGAMFSTHHDAPVAFPDSMRVLDATVTRRSRSGDVIGPDQRVDVITALKAMTIWPAFQHFDEDRKGSLAPGKLADLVVLSGDPTAVDPETLDALRVVETIKAGRTIFAAPPPADRRGALGFRPGRDGADPFAAFLRGAAAARDAAGLGGGPLARAMRRAAAAGPHDAACVAGVLSDALALSAAAR
nr:amidohydrolase [Rubrimonas cliftonensis]